MVPNDPIAAQVATAATFQQVPTVAPNRVSTPASASIPAVPSLSAPGSLVVAPSLSASADAASNAHLSASQRGELELAKQRAQRAAAGRRSQLIAKRAQEGKVRQPPAPVPFAPPVVQPQQQRAQSEDCDDSEGDSDENDPEKDARRLKR